MANEKNEKKEDPSYILTDRTLVEVVTIIRGQIKLLAKKAKEGMFDHLIQRQCTDYARSLSLILRDQSKAMAYLRVGQDQESDLSDVEKDVLQQAMDRIKVKSIENLGYQAGSIARKMQKEFDKNDKNDKTSN